MVTWQWHAAQVDLVDAVELAECSSLIRGINADVKITHTQNSSVKVARLLNQGIYNQDAATAAASHSVQALQRPSKWDRAEKSASASREASSHREHLNHNGDSSSAAPRSAQQAHKIQQQPGQHSHSSRVSTMAIRPSSPVPLQRLVHTHASALKMAPPHLTCLQT